MSQEAQYKDFLEAKKRLEKMVPKEVIERLLKQDLKKESNAKKSLEYYYKQLEEYGEDFLKKIRERKKANYHKRKERLRTQAEEDKKLELARAERIRATGNPFGTALDLMNKKEESEAEDDNLSISSEDAYCSTCGTDAILETVRKSKEIIPPPPQKQVQNYFSEFRYL